MASEHFSDLLQTKQQQLQYEFTQILQNTLDKLESLSGNMYSLTLQDLKTFRKITIGELNTRPNGWVVIMNKTRSVNATEMEDQMLKGIEVGHQDYVSTVVLDDEYQKLNGSYDTEQQIKDRIQELSHENAIWSRVLVAGLNICHTSGGRLAVLTMLGTIIPHTVLSEEQSTSYLRA